MIPCKENKCLVYAACKSKCIIYCEDLMQFIEAKTRAFVSNINNIEKHNLWLHINKVLPEVTRVFPDKNGNNIDLDTISYISNYSAQLMQMINKVGKKHTIGGRLIPVDEEEREWKE